MQLDDSAASQPGDARDAAAASLARFGLDSSLLDGDLNELRETLKNAAAAKTAENTQLATVIEYSLEDAYAKVGAMEKAASGAPAATDYETQLATNMRQANDVAKQLNLGSGDTWGMESLAQDLAVFGLDFTAMTKDPQELAQLIKDRSQEMITDLNKRMVGTEANYNTELRKITGASARLVNGFQGSAGSVFRASMSVSSSVTSVSIDGVRVNANTIIAVGNVIVDPLVFDLNGDGIDLKGADEGVEFDMDGDGSKSTMGFIRGDDAFLFLDEYGDGVVRDGHQLFGNNDGYANGYEKLRAYDDNGDGVIDEKDAIYDQLRLWVEKTEDGVCEREETMSLREAGITSINLGYENVREDDGKGNLVGQVGSFTREDGSSGLAADVWLQEMARVAASK